MVFLNKYSVVSDGEIKKKRNSEKVTYVWSEYITLQVFPCPFVNHKKKIFT